MKKNRNLFFLLVLVLSASVIFSSCAPVGNPAQQPKVQEVLPTVQQISTRPSNPAEYALIGMQNTNNLSNGDYTSQHIITGSFVNQTIDCNAGLLKSDTQIVLLSSVVRLVKVQKVPDIVDPPSINSYTSLQIPTDGRDVYNMNPIDLFGGPFQDTPRLQDLEVITDSMSVGPCGFIDAEGWLYKAGDNYYPNGAVERHTQANIEGEFLINPAYIFGEYKTPTKQYRGSQWLEQKIDRSRFFVIQDGVPDPILCNGIEVPAWSSFDKESYLGSGPLDVDVYDSQKTVALIPRYHVGDFIPTWGTDYPPHISATILGAGWTINGTENSSYVVLGIPDGCTKNELVYNFPIPEYATNANSLSSPQNSKITNFHYKMVTDKGTIVYVEGITEFGYLDPPYCGNGEDTKFDVITWYVQNGSFAVEMHKDYNGFFPHATITAACFYSDKGWNIPTK